MKTTNKSFDAVAFMRQQRDLLSAKLSKMTKEEIIAYFKNRALQSQIKPCASSLSGETHMMGT
jgi:pyridoxine/pyridoxamine 5'-phosphate oxidase